MLSLNDQIQLAKMTDKHLYCWRVLNFLLLRSTAQTWTHFPFSLGLINFTFGVKGFYICQKYRAFYNKNK